MYPRAARDERFDAVVAWHNPDPEYVHEPVSGFVNVMQAPWFTKGKYRSDSNQHWREGCPHEELRAGAFEWLQLLVHPEIWVYDGATMRRDDARDARHEARQSGSSSSPTTGSTFCDDGPAQRIGLARQRAR